MLINPLHLYFPTHLSFLGVLSSSALLPLHHLLSASDSPLGMGRFKSLVNSEEGLESFRALYRISPGVGIRYYKEGE